MASKVGGGVLFLSVQSQNQVWFRAKQAQAFRSNQDEDTLVRQGAFKSARL